MHVRRGGRGSFLYTLVCILLFLSARCLAPPRSPAVSLCPKVGILFIKRSNSVPVCVRAQKMFLLAGHHRVGKRPFFRRLSPAKGVCRAESIAGARAKIRPETKSSRFSQKGVCSFRRERVHARDTVQVSGLVIFPGPSSASPCALKQMQIGPSQIREARPVKTGLAYAHIKRVRGSLHQRPSSSEGVSVCCFMRVY